MNLTFANHTLFIWSLQTLAYYVRHWNYFVKKAASFFLTANSYDLALTKTADEFLGAGFDEPLVNLGQYLPFLANDSPKYEKFGLLLIVSLI